MISIGMIPCALQSKNAPAFLPMRSPAWKRACVLAGRKQWKQKSSDDSQPGRTGSLSGPTLLVRRARSAFMENRNGRASIGKGHSAEEMIMNAVNLNEKIPNNVNLSEDRRLQRALESWQPEFLKWWVDMGPTDYQKDQIYLRTAISVEPSGWAHFDYVKMPDYRWGIFLAAPQHDGTIGF